MTTETQFWLNLAAQVGIAAGTISAVVVALFGGWFRARLAPPKLALQLENPRGVRTPIILAAPDMAPRESVSRWYHVRVSNARRWSPASQVQVFLLRLEERDASGAYSTKWAGEIPIKWRNAEISPVVRTIGYAAECDLCNVVKDKWMELQPLIAPLSLSARRREPCQLRVMLQARSLETDSDPLAIEIAWDGGWAEDTEDMARHMVVKVAGT